MPLRFDAGGSTFEFEDVESLPAGFAQALMSAPGWGDAQIRYIYGTDLAPLLEAHGIDPAAAPLDSAWTVCDARIASDGTLLDALRVATGIGHGPENLVSAEDGDADKEWAVKLESVPRPELREHLKLGCQSLWGSEGLAYCGTHDYAADESVTAEEGSTMIAYWDETQNQRDVSVVQLRRRRPGA